MRTGLTEERNAAVRGNHRRRMFQNALQVLLVDRMEDGQAFALLDHPQHSVGRILHRRFELPCDRHFAQPLAGERRIPFAGGNLHVVRIAAAALFPDEPDRLSTDPRPCRSIPQSLQQALATAFVGPRGQQSRMNARRGCSVRILIYGDVNAACAGLVDQAQRVDALAPVQRADDLVMRDLCGQATFFADLDGLADAVQHPRCFVAHVGDVDSAHLTGNLRQLHDLVRRRERARHIEQAGAQAECAIRHRLPHDRAHLVELGRRGAAIHCSHHGIANGALAHEHPEVRCDASRRDAVEERFDRHRRRAVRTFNERSDALTHVVVRRRHFENAVARVDMNVDEPGRDHFAASIHDLRRRAIDARRDP